MPVSTSEFIQICPFIAQNMAMAALWLTQTVNLLITGGDFSAGYINPPVGVVSDFMSESLNHSLNILIHLENK